MYWKALSCFHSSRHLGCYLYQWKTTLSTGLIIILSIYFFTIILYEEIYSFIASNTSPQTLYNIPHSCCLTMSMKGSKSSPVNRVIQCSSILITKTYCWEMFIYCFAGFISLGMFTQRLKTSIFFIFVIFSFATQNRFLIFLQIFFHDFVNIFNFLFIVLRSTFKPFAVFNVVFQSLNNLTISCFAFEVIAFRPSLCTSSNVHN